MKSKIIIIGSGFAGAYAAREIKNGLNSNTYELKIIDPNPNMLFTPFLHYIVSGTLDIDDIQIPINNFVNKESTEIINDKVINIKPNNKLIETSSQKLRYDYLVIAAGAKTSFYNIPGVKENSFKFKNIKDVLQIRDFIFNNDFKTKDDWNISIIGAGANGIKAASEVNTILKKLKIKNFKIKIYEGSEQILPGFSESNRSYIKMNLEKKGIKIFFNKLVSKLNKDSIEFTDGSKHKSDINIWTAGVIPENIECNPQVKLDKGRICVDDNLQTLKYKDIFVAGDIACQTSKHTSLPYPMIAQVAYRQGIVAGKNVVNSIKSKNLESFEYKVKGQIISLGLFKGSGNLYNFNVNGFIAGIAWYLVYFYKYNYWQKIPKIIYKILKFYIS